MASQLFKVEPHVIEGQHLRGYHNALKSEQEDVLRLAVKHYTPITSSPPGSNRFPPVTIIACHANGFPKEMYEPVWDDLLLATRAQGFDIRGIWFADSVHQGASGVLNEDILGDDPSWYDHSRDLLHMVNTFRASMVRPIIGVAHSMGCAQLTQLSLLHPRLLSSLVLIEPVIQDGPAKGPNASMMGTLRPDLWSSRAEAESPVRKSRLFRTWDPRILDQFLRFSLRDTPTPLHPMPGKVTLTTTKHQESWSYTRANFEPTGNKQVDKWLEPDLHDHEWGQRVFFRPECLLSLQNLPFLAPPVLWMFGGKSILSPPEWIEQKMALTGTGLGGNGGVKADRVHNKVYEDSNHFVICERPKEVTRDIAVWLAECSLHEYVQKDSFLKRYGSKKSQRNMLEVSELWKEGVRKPPTVERPQGPRSKI